MSEFNGVALVLEEDELLNKPLKIEITDEKPFNKCLLCEYLGNGCSGPNIGAMTLGRACEFLQTRRRQLKYTYLQLANKTGLADGTIKSILTGKRKDPSFLSMQALSHALIADPQGKYPCAMHLVSKETDKAIADCKAAQDALSQKEREMEKEKEDAQKKINFLLEQVKFKEAQILEKDKHIASKDKRLEERRDFIYRKDRIITILGIALAICLFLIIGALIVDSLNPNVGFFWLDKLSAAFGGGGIASASLDEATHFLI